MLVVMWAIKGGVGEVVLKKGAEMGPHTEVLLSGPPGRYREVEGPRSIETTLDVIVHRWLEVGTVVYAWNGQRFVSFVVSD